MKSAGYGGGVILESRLGAHYCRLDINFIIANQRLTMPKSSNFVAKFFPARSEGG